jgi:diguanylate cyclase (GGDEF)-like protein/hemerythrin-like metal-binding protein
MYADADREWIDRVAVQALQRIRSLELALDPLSFELWFAYFSGRNRALIDAVNEMLSKEHKPTRQELTRIHGQFLSPYRTAERIDSISSLVRVQSGTLANVIEEAADAARGYEQRLSNAAPRLAVDRVDDGLRLLIRELSAWTNEIQSTNSLLVGRLKGAAEQVRDLQEQLAQVRLESLIDPLTDVGNRKFFETSLARLLKADDEARPLSLLLIDVDDFKMINDTHGHIVGDDVLRLAASTIRQNCRQGDLVCRYGGDEFAVILPRTSLEGALMLGDKIQVAIAARELHRRSTNENLGRLLTSIGAAEYRPGEPAETFVERADHWMYAAKQASRNRGARAGTVRSRERGHANIEVAWHESYACGEAAIDRQHRELFDIANVILSPHIETLEAARVADIVEILIAHVAEHFSYEESVLEAIRYERLEAHRLEHERLLARSRQVKEALASGGAVLGELREFLVNKVVISHMLKEDRRFFPLLEQRLAEDDEQPPPSQPRLDLN